MNLTTFDKKHRRTWKNSIPSVTVDERGKFTFSQGAKRLLSLTEGDRIVFHQDSEARTNWYVEITQKDNGYKIVFGPADSRITCAFAAEELFRSIGKEPFKLRFPIIQNPFRYGDKTFYRIDVRNPLI